MKKIKELYKRYQDWELENVHIPIGDSFGITTNNITIIIFIIIIGAIIHLMK